MAREAYVALALCLMFMNLGSQCYGALQFGFYKGKCNGEDVETIVGDVIKSLINQDRSIVAALLRLQFHDCFVNGCDASILLDGSNSEKTAGPNASVRGYDIIDKIKDALEEKCPGIVSCADIIVMATRDSVALSGGGKYSVQTGRQDGKVSLASKVNLPSPSSSISATAKMFANKNLTASDMVILLGGHTVGTTHCSFIKDRLYNFGNSGQPDKTMNSTLLSKLRKTCPNISSSDNVEVNLDQTPKSDLVVDNSFYQQLLVGEGILQIDQRLASDSLTKKMVADAAKGSDFKIKFGKAMVKLGSVSGSGGGEIRKSCRVVNKRKTENSSPPEKEQTSVRNGGNTNFGNMPFFPIPIRKWS